MKFSTFLIEAVYAELHQILVESVNDYFAGVVAQIKANKIENVDTDQLATLITGLKVLSNPSLRSALTADDVGINPNDLKQLLKLFNDVPRDGKNQPEAVKKAFDALKAAAPKMFKDELAALEPVKDKTDAKHADAVQKLSLFATKVSQTYQKVKTAASASPSASATA